MRKLTTLVASAAVTLTLLGQTSTSVEARGGWGHGGGHHGGWGHHGGFGWGGLAAGLAAGALFYPTYGYYDEPYYGGYYGYRPYYGYGYGPYYGRRHVYYGHRRIHYGHHVHHHR